VDPSIQPPAGVKNRWGNKKKKPLGISFFILFKRPRSFSRSTRPRHHHLGAAGIKSESIPLDGRSFFFFFFSAFLS
jgi:hypothetical protein